MPTIKSFSRKAHGLRNGYRSGLEERVADQLASLKVPYEYEKLKIAYLKPAKKSTYTPDFRILLPNGLIIETKGRFVTADRQKHLLVKEQHPDLDIRFVFSNPKAKLSKTSPTTYAMWCDKNGFLYAKELIPEEWLNEKPRGSLQRKTNGGTDGKKAR